ncbi:DsbA family protein [Paenibacillus thermotolerans]|uniref:DsbA family protein n=1 Tax=Paenibacillus thermotolerans TaxID=3027807 RepID=UPI002367EECF|nr:MULTISPECIES: DsbA family protein [unclassified Paenibacillus]
MTREKSNNKKQRKQQRELERNKQQQRMKWMIVTGSIVIVAFIVLAIVFAPKPKPVEFAYHELPILGSPTAPVKIVEFGDFKCPACQFFSQQIEPLLKQDFIDDGTAALYFMNYPFIGPDSYTAALAGQSIYHQNNNEFWKYYDAIYRDQGDETIQWATPEFLVELAKKEKLNIDYDKLHKEITSQTYADEVNEHNQIAQRLVTSTPTLFINGVKFEDFSDYRSLKNAIQKALDEAKE